MPDSQPDYLGWFNRMAANAPRRPDYVGLPRSVAIEAARAEVGGFARILDLDVLPEKGPMRAWTADGRPDRLNMVVKDGTVVAAAMF